jgi:SET domain-containing protein
MRDSTKTGTFARMARRILRRNSPIHGNGVFAVRDIPKGTTIVEYRGKRLTHAEADRRFGNEVDSGHTFLFTLNDEYLVDGGDGGNIARWINHSCSPNCQAWLIEHAGGDRRRDRIVIEARRNIRSGDELTYDYGIILQERQTERLKKLWACRCGARRCTGTLLQPKKKKKNGKAD